MNRHTLKLLVLAVSVLAVACRGGGTADGAPAAEKPEAAGHAHGGGVKVPAAHAEHGEGDGHGHGEGEASDLDRPVAPTLTRPPLPHGRAPQGYTRDKRTVRGRLEHYVPNVPGGTRERVC